MKFKMMCAALTATTIAPAAMAEFEISFDVAGLEAGFVNVDAANDYAGRDILRVGYRDMVIENTALGANQAQFGWSLDLSALEYGINFFSLAAPVDLTIGSNTIADIEHDVSGYLALVALSVVQLLTGRDVAIARSQLEEALAALEASRERP